MINIIALKETFCSSSHSQGEIAGKIGKNNHNKALIECELAIWKMLPRMLPARKKVLPGHTTNRGVEQVDSCCGVPPEDKTP